MERDRILTYLDIALFLSNAGTNLYRLIAVMREQAERFGDDLDSEDCSRAIVTLIREYRSSR